mmetsp:Transcript_25722/g.61944  ORF Transcript_25722/g.61944 Transcript_25722/m.61944 type:complete len:238 (+) Transcript_25722:46-759(+)
MSSIDSAKRKAAFAAVDEFVKSGMNLGIGSGSTVVFAVERLKDLVDKGTLKNLVCVPTSFQSSILLKEAGLTTSDPNDTPDLDVAIDGADEVDNKLNCIKGGGACQLQEKIVASCAKIFVVIADYRKESKVLGEKWKKGVPVEVVPMAYRMFMNRCAKMNGKAVLRMAKSKAGPVVSDNGNFIVDVDFGEIADPTTLEQKLKMIPGVVEVGLFIGMAAKAFFGQEDGSVTTRTLGSM